MLAGVYVGFGSFLAFTVGANLQEMAVSNPGLQKFLYGAIGLPAGLVMVRPARLFLSLLAVTILKLYQLMTSSDETPGWCAVRVKSCSFMMIFLQHLHSTSLSRWRCGHACQHTGEVLQVLVCGAELFTSNTALMPVAYYEKKATLQQVKSPQESLLSHLNIFCQGNLTTGAPQTISQLTIAPGSPKA